MKDFFNKQVLITLFFAVLAYAVIISLAVGIVFLCKDVFLPYFGKEPLPKILFLLGIIFLNVIVFAAMCIIHSRLTIISFIIFSVFISACLLVAGISSFFGFHINSVEVIFSWTSFLYGFLMLIWNFILFVTRCSSDN